MWLIRLSALGNLTQGIQDTFKGVVFIDSGSRTVIGIYKSTVDFARGDTLCVGLCCVSIGLELTAGVLV
tara:strand:- start:5115 stop:5321 length:207 start_codon:yes stop_codon:yes gene_type:complete